MSYLAQVVLTGEPRTLPGLHEAARVVAILVDGAHDTDVAGTLLENDGQDDTVLDANFGGSIANCNVQALKVGSAVAGAEHAGCVGGEDLVKRLPSGHGREVGCWSSIKLSAGASLERVGWDGGSPSQGEDRGEGKDGGGQHFEGVC